MKTPKEILSGYEQIKCDGETHIYVENVIMAMHEYADQFRTPISYCHSHDNHFNPDNGGCEMCRVEASNQE